MKFRGIAVMLIAVTLLTGCTNLSELGKESKEGQSTDQIIAEQGEAVTHENILKIPIAYKMSFNPYVAKDKTWIQFNKLIFEGLFNYDENYLPQPYLVDLLESNDEGTRFRMKIKEGVSFHNGDPMTVDDIVFTYNFFKQEYLNTPFKDFVANTFEVGGSFGDKFSIQKLSSSEFIVQTNRAYVNLFDFLTLPILSKRTSLNGLGDGSGAYRKLMSKDNAFKVNGTGPYQFKSFEELKSYKLEANGKWWKGTPKIAEVEGIIVSSEDAVFTTVLSGVADIAKTEYEDWGKHSENNGVTTYEYPDMLYDVLAYNGRSKYFANRLTPLKTYIDSKLNRKSILTNIYLGHGYDAKYPINPLISKIEAPVQGEAKQKTEQLLPLENYTQKNENGYWVNEKGQKIELRLLTLKKDNYLKIAESIEKDMNKAGILVKIQVAETWENYMTSLATDKYDMAIVSIQMPMLLDYKNVLHSSGAVHAWAGYDSQIDIAISEYMRQSPLKKKVALEQLIKVVDQYKPFSTLVFRNNAVILNKKVQGDIKPFAFDIYHSIENWSIQ